MKERHIILIISLYILATFSIYCYWNYYIGERSGDEAIFEQCFWYASHQEGYGLVNTLEGTFGKISHECIHFSPILYIIALFYKILPSMHIVHLIVSMNIALAGYFLYKTAKIYHNFFCALVIMLSFLIHPTVILQTFMAFHELSLVFLPLALLIYGYVKKNNILVVISSILLLSVREDTFLVIIVLALLLIFWNRKYKLGALLIGISVCWLSIYYFLILKFLCHGELPSIFGQTYSSFGDTSGEIIKNILTSPIKVIRHIFSKRVILYLIQLLVPFFIILPFMSRIFVLLLPHLFLILLADFGTRLFQIRLHYSIIPVSVLFFSTIISLRLEYFENLKINVYKKSINLKSSILVCILIMNILLMPLWVTKLINRQNPYADNIKKFLEHVPKNVSVQAPSYLCNRLAKRTDLRFSRKYQSLEAEYIIVEDENLLFYEGSTTHEFYNKKLHKKLVDNGYEIVYKVDGLYLYKFDKKRF